MTTNSGNSPRKFSEKIAILERKQNEENTTFEDIMRQVRSITHDPVGPSGTSTAPMAIPQQGTSGGLHPPQWGHNLGGSLPNVHQMPSYSPPQWPPNWQANNIDARGVPTHRSRSPDGQMISGSPTSSHHHYHPYGRAQGRSPDRITTQFPYGQPPGYQGHLVPPENWNQINRARSDPAIHNMGMHPAHMFQMHHVMPQYIQNAMPGPSGMQHQQQQQQQQHQQTPSNHNRIPQPIQCGQNGGQMNNQNGMSPLQSPVNHMMHPMYNYSNGSPMQSPLGSPHASSLVLDGSSTPCMELSPPGMHDFNQEVGSLPNLQQMGQSTPINGTTNGSPSGYYHQPVGPRHSTGTCGPRLAPGPILTPESQSAPTSPHNQIEMNQQLPWPTRTFSNSPEALDIPKLVLTNAEGTPGQHLECFNDLQDLTLDSTEMNIICNGTSIPSNSNQSSHQQQYHVGGPPTAQML